MRRVFKFMFIDYPATTCIVLGASLVALAQILKLLGFQ